MRDTRQEDKVKAIEKILCSLPIRVDEEIYLEPYQVAESILQAIEQVETDYHNKWEEMKCEEQYQEKNGDTL